MDGSRAWRAVLDEHVGNGIMRLVLFEIAFSFLIGRKEWDEAGNWLEDGTKVSWFCPATCAGV